MGKYSDLLSETVQEKIEILIDEMGRTPHMPLPSERALAENLGVNRQTLRTALMHLRDENIIYTIHGRGNFIAPPKYVDDTTKLASFSEGWEEDGFTTQSRTLTCELVEAPINVSTRLNLPLGEDVNVLRRIRYINDEPVTIETSYIPAALAPDMQRFNFDKLSLFAILKGQYDVVITSMDEKISATTLTSQEKEALESDSDLGFCVQTLAFSSDMIPIEYCVAISRADKLKLVSLMRVE